MFKHLFAVNSIAATWGDSPLSSKPIEGSFKFVTCHLVLNVEDGRELINELGTSFSNPSFRVDGESSQPKRVEDPDTPGGEDRENHLFTAAWQVAEKCYSISSWGDASFKAEALSLLKSEASISILSAFTSSLTWKQNLISPKLVMLRSPRLINGVLYKNALWSHDASVEKRNVFDLLSETIRIVPRKAPQYESLRAISPLRRKRDT